MPENTGPVAGRGALVDVTTGAVVEGAEVVDEVGTAVGRGLVVGGVGCDSRVATGTGAVEHEASATRTTPVHAVRRLSIFRTVSRTSWVRPAVGCLRHGLGFLHGSTEGVR